MPIAGGPDIHRKQITFDYGRPPLVIGHAPAHPHLPAVPLGRARGTVIRLNLRAQPQIAATQQCVSSSAGR